MKKAAVRTTEEGGDGMAYARLDCCAAPGAVAELCQAYECDSAQQSHLSHHGVNGASAFLHPIVVLMTCTFACLDPRPQYQERKSVGSH